MTRFSGIALLAFLALSANTYALGLIPTPTLTNVGISADVVFDPSAGYTYTYTVNNPASNTGVISSFRIDVTAGQSGNGMAGNSFGLTIPLGSNRFDFSFLLSRLEGLNTSVSTPGFLQDGTIVPFGQNVPSGWNGGLGMGGFASFSVQGGATGISPGSSLGGFQLLSFGVPTIRKVRFIPLWMYVADDHDTVTQADMQAAGQLEQSIVFQATTLGASGVAYGSFGQWNELRDDLAQAIQLKWIIDPSLANTLTTQLASARQALDAGDLFTAKVRLQTMLDTINQSTPAQRTSEGFALVALNVQSLIDNTGDNPLEPKITISPQSATLSVGATQTLTATLIDLANGSRPIADSQVTFHIDSGPDAGIVSSIQTDAQGHAVFNYVGSQAGTDTVVATAPFFGGEVTFNDTGLVRWTGGVDLVVPLFIPPLLITTGGRTFYITEQTQNIGNLAVPPTVTRYFISQDQNIDPTTARPVGERSVPALQPNQVSAIQQQSFTIPSDLPDGTYFLAACADANNAVVELDENNNCSFIRVQGRQSFVVPINTPNHPPVCASAAPSVATLWPPNHKLVAVTVQGVTDPEQDPVSIQITSITQDEPVNGLGDGDTSPDGFGVGTNQALLRAERSGLGNGRVYAVSFTASDGKGGTCAGKVSVGVPHDQGKGSVPVDDGQIYDSTVP